VATVLCEGRLLPDVRRLPDVDRFSGHLSFLAGTAVNKLIDAVQVYRLYRKHKNGIKHSAKAAYYIAIVGTPF